MLEHHASIQSRAINWSPVDQYLPFGWPEKAGNDVEERRLAASATTYQCDEFIGPDAEVNVFQRDDVLSCCISRWESLCHILGCNFR